MQRTFIALLLLAAATASGAEPVATSETVEQRCIVQIDRIWDRAAHSAFTDLLWYQGALYCTFREGSGHIPGLNGVVRVIRSRDRARWESVGLLEEAGIDLRDPKLSFAPRGGLVVNTGASTYHGSRRLGIASRVAFSTDDGAAFGPPQVVRLPPEIETGFDWLWRITWHDDWAWGAVQQVPPAALLKPGETRRLHLVRSRDAITWEHVSQVPLAAPSETTLRFLPDDTLLAMIRTAKSPAIGQFGVSRPPYRDWQLQPAGKQFGGPNFVPLPGDVWLAGSRDYETNPPTTALWGLDPRTGRVRPLLTLPSSGDNSYPGFVVDEERDRLYVSYYSAHEGKASIYLATLRLRAVIQELSR